MESSPYEAAGAALGDAQQAVPIERPRSVRRLVALAWLGVAIHVLTIVFNVMQGADPLRFYALPPALGVIALNILLIYKLHQGKAWARAIYVALAVIGVVAGMLLLLPGLGWEDTAAGVCQLALYLAILFLLFARPTREWFAAMHRLQMEDPTRKALESPDSRA